MVSICNMSRYITIIVVENLTKTAILKAIQQHKFRFGETKEIFSDKGTNYTGAQRVLEEENEESLTQSVMNDVKKELKSVGTEIITRVARAPWIQGSQERAISTVKRLWPARKMDFHKSVTWLIKRCLR